MIRPIARWSGGDEHGGDACEPNDHVAAGNWLGLLANQKRQRDPARPPNKNADPERTRDRARNRPLRDRPRDPLENPIENARMNRPAKNSPRRNKCPAFEKKDAAITPLFNTPEPGRRSVRQP